MIAIKKQKFTSLRRGSTILFSLIILSILMAIALSLSTAALTARKNSSSTRESVTAFQVADNGVELALQAFYRQCGGNGCQTVDKLNGPGSNLNGRCNDGSGTAIFTPLPIGDSRGQVTVVFYKGTGSNKTAIASCINTDPITSMKIVGSYSGLSRALEVAL